MNRKEIAELMSIIQAFLEGKTIERKTRSWELNKGWRDATQWEETEELKLRDTFVYRIKPEPKPEPKPSYRPFANVEECWNEMQKHQPFGWVRSKDNGNRSLITLMTSERDISINSFSGLTMYELMEKFTFDDGAVFGILEEE